MVDWSLTTRLVDILQPNKQTKGPRTLQDICSKSGIAIIIDYFTRGSRIHNPLKQLNTRYSLISTTSPPKAAVLKFVGSCGMTLGPYPLQPMLSIPKSECFYFIPKDIPFRKAI